MAGGDDRQEKLESEVRDMHLKEDAAGVDLDSAPLAECRSTSATQEASASASRTGTPAAPKKASRSPAKHHGALDSPALKPEQEDLVGGDVLLKMDPVKPLKPARTAWHKVEKRAPPLFLEYEDKTPEASAAFDVLPECTYANKYLGSTEHALECDCAEEWDPASRTNHACGEDSDCINRATKMECVGDCNCGSACQNQRFQLKQYADVTVIQTEKKGYGLRANTNLRANDFIFEYIGEVIGENVFRRRMQQYDEQGIKHFYFMSLTKGEFVDATKKGNLGRFCNHSCNPNCYVDKWVVGDKLRMGIFAERKIKAGEELVFNYNVDRYGAEPQPCYCGESNCTGYIGGKTQTERATKLSNAVIEALGIDDADAWDTAVAKKPRKKKVGEDDEEYVNNVEPRGLDEDGVNKVMSSLMQCKEKWIAVKLLTRIQRAEDERVRNRVVRFHGYRILKTALTNFIEDVNVCLQILDVLEKMPRLTRNKIQDSNIEEAVSLLTNNEDARVSAQATELLDSWSKLEVAYRIPRVKRDPNAVQDRKLERIDRRDGERRRSKSRSRSKSPERVQAPTGPRNGALQRAPFARPPPRFRPPPPVGPLPPGWFETTAANGSVYYYTQSGTTTWQRPTMPATAAPPPPPPKTVSDQQMLQDLIKNIVASKKEQPKQPSATATPVETPKKEKKQEKWRTLPEEKQKRLYEGALQPHIMHVVGKYKHKLAKEDLKRWAKEFAKQMVDSDFKKDRVEHPNKVNDKRAKDVKKHAQAFFEKALKKKEVADQKKAERQARKEREGRDPKASAESPQLAPGSALVDEELALSDHDMDDADGDADADSTPVDSALKRTREELGLNEDDDLLSKKQRTESAEAPAPPPPPPPPAEDNFEDDHATPRTNEDDAHGTPAADCDLGFSVKGVAQSSHSRPASQNGDGSHLATPPTTGSPEHDEAEKTNPRANFASMNPDRMRQLGLMDGASG